MTHSHDYDYWYKLALAKLAGGYRLANATC